MSVNDPMSERVTYAFPPEPDGPVWDKDGNKWEYDGGFWKGPGTARWSVLLRDHGPLTNTEPLPDWPTAALLWWDGEVWTRDEDSGLYESLRRTVHGTNLALDSRALAFAREAVPVTPAPTREWEAWRRYALQSRERHRTEVELMTATDVLAGW